MWLIALEAGFALLALIFIVWWTMFSGRDPDQPLGGTHNSDAGHEQ